MKYALVTGGTKGIGMAIGKALLQNGYFVVLNYANDDIYAQNTLKKLNSIFPNQVVLIKEDLSKCENVVALYDKLMRIMPSIDALILNVGKTDRTPFGEIPYTAWHSIFETNVYVPLFLIQQLYSIISENGSITITGSSMGIHPHSTSVAYGVSKSATHALVKNLVKYLSLKKIRINGIAPGFVDTEWQNGKPEWLKENIKNKIALNRFCTTDEVAQLAMSIIGNEYLNGEIIQIDGGYNFE